MHRRWKLSGTKNLERSNVAFVKFCKLCGKQQLNLTGTQVTAQEVSTMLRWGQKSIIFLINNGGYTIEVEIHDGPYNVIKNWNYTGVVEAFHNGEGKCYTAKVSVAIVLQTILPWLEISHRSNILHSESCRSEPRRN